MTTNNNLGHFQLRIAKQPPGQVVYQRILKPFPAVILLAPDDTEDHSDLFVEATLVRSDTGVELDQTRLHGTKVKQISTGVFVTFKKLKILATSRQQGTLPCLKFQLKRSVGDTFEVIEGVSVTSEPIDVFSHTMD